MDVDEEPWCYGKSRGLTAKRGKALNVMALDDSRELRADHGGWKRL